MRKAWSEESPEVDEQTQAQFEQIFRMVKFMQVGYRHILGTHEVQDRIARIVVSHLLHRIGTTKGKTQPTRHSRASFSALRDPQR
jgi:hypothetical protein